MTMKITRRQLRMLVEQVTKTDFVYPTDVETGSRRPDTHSAFSGEDQTAANNSYNEYSDDIDTMIPANSGFE